MFDLEVDLLVVGSGAGGMTAALAASELGLETLLVEKAPVYGGTTALSGGTIWVPCNHLMRRKGLSDAPDDALGYLHGLTRGTVPAGRIEAYVHTAPQMVAWLEERSEVRFDSMEAYPDYYPSVQGARSGGRTLEALPYARTKLGREQARLRPPHPQQLALGRAAVTAREARIVLGGGVVGRGLVLRRLLAYWLDLPARLGGPRDRRLCLGNALVGRLRRSLMDRGVPLWLGCAARELVREGERVAGAVVDLHGAAVRIGARRGVVLAAGGFARNRAMREQHQPSLPTGWTAAVPEDQGEGITLGQSVGGAVTLMDEAWWMPTAMVPGEGLAWVLVAEKSLPGCIIVDRSGRRFTNEAGPYTDVVKAMQRHGVPAYFIADARYRRRYPLGPLMPLLGTPRALRGSFVREARSVGALADALGVARRGLEATIESFNRNAALGRDPDFDRGASLNDRYYGDDAVAPNPCLRPIEKPPFSGIEVWAGDLGTKGGLVTDAHARVLDAAGAAVTGLYAVGNTTASVMGPAYPGAGSTLGPAMTFGYLAGRHAASWASRRRGRPVTPEREPASGGTSHDRAARLSG